VAKPTKNQTAQDALREVLEDILATKPFGTAAFALQVIAALYADDGATLSRLKVEDATNPNLLVGLREGTSQAAIRAATDASVSSATKALNTLAQLTVNVVTTADAQGLRVPYIFKTIAAVSIIAGTGATIWTPSAGKKVRLIGWALSVSAAAALEFHDNVIGTPIMKSPLLAAGGVDHHEALSQGVILAAANNVLKLDTTANAIVTGMVWGTQE
jgi:hypothetical protein